MAGAKLTRSIKQDIERDLEDAEYARLYGAADAQNELAIAFGRLRLAYHKQNKVLAAEMGVHLDYIIRICKGEGNPSIGKIGALLARIGLRLVLRTAPLLRKES